MTRWLALLALSACIADPAVRKSDAWNQAAGYGSHATQAGYTLARYDFAIAAMSLENCAGIFETYENQISVEIERLNAGAAFVDMTITANEGAAYADAECVALAIRAELTAHTATACTLATTQDNLVEATRHIQLMSGYLEHAKARALEVTTGIDTKSFTWTLPYGCP